jgi:hypothetical protein
MQAPAQIPWDLIDRTGNRPFIPEGREQPEAPPDRAVFEAITHV